MTEKCQNVNKSTEVFVCFILKMGMLVLYYKILYYKYFLSAHINKYNIVIIEQSFNLLYVDIYLYMYVYI